MNEGRSTNGTAQRSWLERLSHVLLGEPKDREQLIELLRDAQQRQLLDSDALAMIEGVLQVSEMQVRDIMVPRAQMVVVDRDAALQEILPVITESEHSRFPVIGDSRDEVIGILLAKDLLGYFVTGRHTVFNVRDILRPAVFIPESKRLNVLLKEFRASRNHMAIVVDEYGGVSGLVTIEDVLEQIVGEIADEHDIDEDAYIKKHSDFNYTVKALTPIDEFNSYFGSDFSDEEFDTIGGLVVHDFGKVPRRGEALAIGRFRFKVLHADNRRIHLLQVTMRTQEDEIEQPTLSGES
ncbi:MAG: CBS domain-containing protein [Gammaproteobacteria bacterium]|nr:CBS domain-containing protein [Gammaproteobacteria bacterium]